MNPYDFLPFLWFLLGTLFGWTFFRERLQRLRCQRNLAEYRADEAAGKTAKAEAGRARAEQERDDAAALAVSLQEGATYAPVPSYVDRAQAERLNAAREAHPSRFLRSIPKEGQR